MAAAGQPSLRPQMFISTWPFCVLSLVDRQRTKMRKKAKQRHDPAVLEMKGDFASIVGDDDIRGHRRPCSHGEPLSSQLRHRKMYLRHKHCLYGGQSVTFNHAEEWEGAFLTSTAGTADKTVTAATSIAATATTVTNKSCARAAAANDKPAGLD